MERCTIFLENNQTELLSLKVEHGLSILIESAGCKYLFDCGASKTLMENALLLNQDLNDIDALILSHSHYDHAAGARPFIEEHGLSRLIVGNGFFNPKYAINKGIFTYLGAGFDEKYLKTKMVETEICYDILPINSKLSIVGNFKRYKEFDEPIPDRFVIMDKEGNFTKDNFEDEISIVYDDGDSLTLIVGCSHPGILSMTKYVGEKFNKKVKRIFGGIHLNSADLDRLRLTIKVFEDLGVEEVGLCHCSGNKISELLKKESSIITSHIIGAGDGFLL